MDPTPFSLATPTRTPLPTDQLALFLDALIALRDKGVLDCPTLRPQPTAAAANKGAAAAGGQEKNGMLRLCGADH